MPELSDAVAAGRVTARRHPTLPYTIFNYSPDVQYSNSWDDVTLNCRGLILDDEANIVARPWKKFFNLGQVNLPIQFDTPVEIMDKVDGSLGILYPAGYGVWSVATRGSFTSDQAIHATKVWVDNYEEYYNDPAEAEALKGLTVLFEIVYPENRIVLDYGGKDDLVLLGAVETSSGYYFGPTQTAAMISWPGEVVEVMPFNTLSEALAHTDRPNAEGFVIRSHNFMVKLKQPDYLELHRLVTNASPKTVWDQLRQGKSKSQIVSAFPDEFHDYIGSMIDPLVAEYDRRLEEIMESYGRITGGIKHEASRKEYATAFSRHQDKRYFFLLLDSKPVNEVLWMELKPRSEPVGANQDAL